MPTVAIAQLVEYPIVHRNVGGSNPPSHLFRKEKYVRKIESFINVCSFRYITIDWASNWAFYCVIFYIVLWQIA